MGFNGRLRRIQQLILLIVLVQEINSEYILSIELNRFENPFGLLVDGSKCESSCLTYFNFCLTADNSECLSVLKTEILGGNVLNETHFSSMSNRIQFHLNSSWAEDRRQFYLAIQALNSENKPDKSNVIGEWKLPIRFFELHKWIRYDNSVNSQLQQTFLFDYRLDCADDYYGTKCEIPVCATGCDLSRGGYCLKPNECICKPGYFGSNCDFSSSTDSWPMPTQHECVLPCQNGGKCVNGQCKCDTRLYIGEQCQMRIVESCPTSTTCMNGGSCLASGECLCAPGYKGLNCEKKAKTSQCGPVTCFNGGTCFIDNRNEYSCKCESGFRGKYCQDKIFQIFKTVESQMNKLASSYQQIENTTQNSYEFIAITIVGIAIPILLILLTCFLCRLTIKKYYNSYSSSFSEPTSFNSSSSYSSKQLTKPTRVKSQNIYVSNVSRHFNGLTTDLQQNQDPNTIYDSLYEDFLPSASKIYAIKNNYDVVSSLV